MGEGSVCHWEPPSLGGGAWAVEELRKLAKSLTWLHSFLSDLDCERDVIGHFELLLSRLPCYDGQEPGGRS